MIWILTLSNKPDYLVEAEASVAAQTRRDFRHVVELDNPTLTWAGYPPAVIFNKWAERALPEHYIAWLSDDDLLEPTFCETLAGYLDAHPEVGCVYGGARHVSYDIATGITTPITERPALHAYDARHMPLCQIDGGQIMVRRSALEAIGRPFCPEGTKDANIADGLMMNRIAARCGIVPVVGSWVMTNRTTPKSSHWYLEGSQIVRRTTDQHAA